MTMASKHPVTQVDAYDDGTHVYLKCEPCGWETKTPIPAQFAPAVILRHQQLASTSTA